MKDKNKEYEKKYIEFYYKCNAKYIFIVYGTVEVFPRNVEKG